MSSTRLDVDAYQFLCAPPRLPLTARDECAPIRSPPAARVDFSSATDFDDRPPCETPTSSRKSASRRSPCNDHLASELAQQCSPVTEGERRGYAACRLGPGPALLTAVACDTGPPIGCTTIHRRARGLRWRPDRVTRWDVDPERPILWTAPTAPTAAVGRAGRLVPRLESRPYVLAVRQRGRRHRHDPPGWDRCNGAVRHHLCPGRPDLSPDGATIIFSWAPVKDDQPGFETTLWTMSADGAAPHELALSDGGGDDYEAQYSPDGSRIVFTRLDHTTDESAQFIANADGSDVEQLTPYEHISEHPHWSPDGSTIIYNIEDQRNLRDPINGIWVVPSSGGTPSQLLAVERVASRVQTRLLGRRFADPVRLLLVGHRDRRSLRDERRRHRRPRDRGNRGTFENHPIWN